MVSARLPIELVEELREMAASEQVPVTALVEAACRQLLAPPAAPAQPEPHKLVVRSGNRVSYYTDYAGAGLC